MKTQPLHSNQSIFPIKQLVYENEHSGYYHPAYVRKVPKYYKPIDFDSDTNKIEVEWTGGERSWHDVTDLFGWAIGLKLYVQLTEKQKESLFIKSVVTFKVKRTWYMKLIFDYNLPF